MRGDGGVEDGAVSSSCPVKLCGNQLKKMARVGAYRVSVAPLPEGSRISENRRGPSEAIPTDRPTDVAGDEVFRFFGVYITEKSQSELKGWRSTRRAFLLDHAT